MRFLVIIACILTLTACVVVTHTEFRSVNEDDQEPAKIDVKISYSSPPGFASLFERTFASSAQAVGTTGPEQGLHCVVSDTSEAGQYSILPYPPLYPSLFGRWLSSEEWAWLSIVSFSAVPWITKVDYAVEYDLYSDGRLQSRYQYTYRKERYGGILMLLMVWLNWFTMSEEEALKATFYNFVHDAKRDGYWSK